MKLRLSHPDPHGVVTLHASAVRTDTGAAIFLGPSGTGKSTIVRLLAERTGVIAEDKVYLAQRSDGVWGIADATERSRLGPLSDEEAFSLEIEPLSAIYRLHQSADIRVEPIDALTLCRYLVDAFLEVWWNIGFKAGIYRDWFSRIAQLSRAVEGYDLYFSRTPQVADVLIGNNRNQQEILETTR